MKKYLVSLMALLALTGLVLLAADIDGTWTAETQGKNGPQTQTLTLISKGGELTGKLDNGRGGADISEGKIDGSQRDRSRSCVKARTASKSKSTKAR